MYIKKVVAITLRITMSNLELSKPGVNSAPLLFCWQGIAFDILETRSACVPPELPMNTYHAMIWPKLLRECFSFVLHGFGLEHFSIWCVGRETNMIWWMPILFARRNKVEIQYIV